MIFLMIGLAVNALGGACHFEVHLTVKVFNALNINKGSEVIPVLNQAAGNTGNRGLDGHTGVHEGEGAGADGSHGAGTVRLQDVADDADGVGIVCGNLTLQGTPCEVSVANLATAYAALGLGLAGAERWEVVVEQEPHVALVQHIVNEFLVELGSQRAG